MDSDIVNSGNDIFVDIGGKDLGVLACRNYFGGVPPERTIHCGDQFLSLSSSNDFRVYFWPPQDDLG